MFPGQGADNDKVFVFKMSEVGPASNVDLVTRNAARRRLAGLLAHVRPCEACE